MEITRETARRLMIEKQRFGPRRNPVKKEDILETVRALGCIQTVSVAIIAPDVYPSVGKVGRQTYGAIGYEGPNDAARLDIKTSDGSGIG